MKHKVAMIIFWGQELMTAEPVFKLENDMPCESKPEFRIEPHMFSGLDKILTKKQACRYIRCFKVLH